MKTSTETQPVELSGGLEFHKLQVADSDKLARIVTAQLYKDPLVSVVREILSNAVDSHMELLEQDGQPERPIQIGVDSSSNELYVADYGVGLSPEQVPQLLLSITGSSKDSESSGRIGGWGLGAKSPWALSPTWHFELRHEGALYSYFCSNSNGQLGHSQPLVTQRAAGSPLPNGVTIKVPLKAEQLKRAERVIRWYAAWFLWSHQGTGLEIETLSGEALKAADELYSVAAEPLYTHDDGSEVYRVANRASALLTAYEELALQDESRGSPTLYQPKPKTLLLIGGVPYLVAQEPWITGDAWLMPQVAVLPVGSVLPAPSRDNLMQTPEAESYLRKLEGRLVGAIEKELRALSVIECPMELAERLAEVPTEFARVLIPASSPSRGPSHYQTAERVFRATRSIMWPPEEEQQEELPPFSVVATRSGYPSSDSVRISIKTHADQLRSLGLSLRTYEESSRYNVQTLTAGSSKIGGTTIYVGSPLLFYYNDVGTGMVSKITGSTLPSDFERKSALGVLVDLEDVTVALADDDPRIAQAEQLLGLKAGSMQPVSGMLSKMSAGPAQQSSSSQGYAPYRHPTSTDDERLVGLAQQPNREYPDDSKWTGYVKLRYSGGIAFSDSTRWDLSEMAKLSTKHYYLVCSRSEIAALERLSKGEFYTFLRVLQTAPLPEPLQTEIRSMELFSAYSWNNLRTTDYADLRPGHVFFVQTSLDSSVLPPSWVDAGPLLRAAAEHVWRYRETPRKQLIKEALADYEPDTAAAFSAALRQSTEAKPPKWLKEAAQGLKTYKRFARWVSAEHAIPNVSRVGVALGLWKHATHRGYADYGRASVALQRELKKIPTWLMESHDLLNSDPEAYSTALNVVELERIHRDLTQGDSEA